MCKLCEGKLTNRRIEEGWLYLEDDQLPNAVITFPVHYCPWCGKKVGNERMMPRINPHDWKEHMREQEAEEAENEQI